MSFCHKGNPVHQTHSQHQRHQTSTIKNPGHKQHASTKNSQISRCIPWTHQVLWEIYQEICQDVQAINIIDSPKSKIWMDRNTSYSLLMLKESFTQAPILCYLDPTKQYIVYTDAWDNASGAQLSQEHDEMKFPIAFLLHTFMDTQRKWSITEQEAYGVYYTVTKWNYYLQGAEVIICNDHKLLARFLNRKNANNKVNRWQLELAT